MEKTLHCQLCDNQSVDFNTGSLCKLTLKKPDFIEVCKDIKLRSQFEQKIKGATAEYHNILKTKWWTYGYFILFTSLSAGVFYLALQLGGFINRGSSSSPFTHFYGIVVPLIVGAIALKLLAQAIGVLNTYNANIKLVKRKLDTIKQVLLTYGVQYTVDVTMGNSYHDHQEIGMKFNWEYRPQIQAYIKNQFIKNHTL